MENNLVDKEKLNDEQLCDLAKNGDATCMNILLERYKYAVVKISRSYFLIDGDSDDLFQEGLLAVFRAITTFQGNSPFKPYCFKCIKNAIISALRLSNRNNNSPLNNYLSYTDFSNEDDIDKNSILSNIIDPEKEVIDKESKNELDKNIKDCLSSLEYEILCLYLKGYSYTDIGNKTKKNIKSVDNAIQRIRKKIFDKIINR